MSSRTRRLSALLRDLHRAADAVPDGLVLLDHEDRVRWFNQAAQRLLGLRRPGDFGRVLAERMAGSELDTWLRGGAHVPIDEVAAPAEPGVHLNVALIPFGVSGRLLLARDVSELMRLEQVRRDFVANVSHELRTPLTVIHGYLDLLEPGDAPALAPVLTQMRAQSRRMGRIVEDLLTVSRLQTQQHLPEERVAMAPLLAELRKEAEALSQGGHRIESVDSADADLLGSSSDLHSAFSNLVSNAVRYTPTGGHIVLRWERTPGGATYSVSDTGFGISAVHLARLTERFYRVSSSRSRETGGTGLGLAIVKHVLNLHQARLAIESEPGHGSTFACVFDAARVLEPGASRD
ncbi:MAG TPA: phosphate regulon sensor histidine kinase PhoR [Rhodanobacteraceae bacterium]|nr:phosphate regulon sensor histidine kinase PhoR [Rhodanobacteraceae bacterium]